jgi:hypothetical protein
MSNTTLDAIRTKVRRLTRSPSSSQLSDAQIDEYVNTFVLYDFPEQLRLFSLRTLLTFYTQPNVDTYSTETTVVTDPLYNFKNKYIAVHPPIFLAGIQGFFTQKREIFYGYWPQTNTIADTLLRGDGTTGPFTGTIFAKPMLQNNVNINCLDTADTSMILVDYPVTGSTTTGALGLPNQPQTLPSPYGQINYITGVFTAIFPNNTKVSAPIYVNNIAYQPGKPLSMLYYDNTFTIRPVPDKTYAIQIEVDVRPTELLAASDVPDLEQWWQFISYGASKKIFEDRMDMDSVQMIMAEFKQQERLVLRTTLSQQANERTSTIYTQGRVYGFGWFGPGGWPY